MIVTLSIQHSWTPPPKKTNKKNHIIEVTNAYMTSPTHA